MLLKDKLLAVFKGANSHPALPLHLAYFTTPCKVLLLYKLQYASSSQSMTPFLSRSSRFSRSYHSIVTTLIPCWVYMDRSKVHLLLVLQWGHSLISKTINSVFMCLSERSTKIWDGFTQMICLLGRSLYSLLSSPYLLYFSSLQTLQARSSNHRQLSWFLLFLLNLPQQSSKRRK